MDSSVCLIDSAKQCAIEVERVLYREGLLNNDKAKGKIKFFVSDEQEKFAALGKRLLGSSITCIRRPDEF